MDRDSERNARDFDELNFALIVLRALADKDGYVPGSPVQRIYDARGKRKISISRVRDLVTKLGELGWREEVWIGPGNIYGSKIVMKPDRIMNLSPLPAKVAHERLKAEASLWARRYFNKIDGPWRITNPRNPSEIASVAIRSQGFGRLTRGQGHHRLFKLAGIRSRAIPGWLKKLLSPDETLSDVMLYQLWKANNATPDGRF